MYARILLLLALCGVAFTQNSFRARPHIVVNSGPLNLEDELATRYSRRQRTASMSILTPPELRAIYGIENSTSAGAGKTIAIVDAYGASTVEADLAVFSARFGLPACTTANSCFKKVDQNGGSAYPPDDSGWSSEVALDVQTVHSLAQGANILLVVANSDSGSDLFAAVTYATAHADYVSMSFGMPEGDFVNSYDTTYFANNPTVSFFASTGDNGAAGGVEFPSTSPNVVAVGGTSVYVNTDFTLGSEQGWSGSGGGCSAYFTAPAVQLANAGYANVGCNGKRAVPDVSMDGDPNSGVYVYVSAGCASTSPADCYYEVGGTSLAAPIFAARAAIHGVQVNVAYVYSSSITYRDITQGSNGAYNCTTGLDLVTGQGTWIAPN